MFYYDDDLSAIWMMSKHGIRLETHDGKPLEVRDGRVGFWEAHPNRPEQRIFVENGDYHHVVKQDFKRFKPQLGDMLQTKQNWNRAVTVSKFKGKPLRGKIHIKSVRDHYMYIITRNGLAFMYPEIDRDKFIENWSIEADRRIAKALATIDKIQERKK